MCEKNSGYKTFAHIRVSLDPSLRGGFYFVYGMAPSTARLQIKRVTTVIIFYSQTNQKAEPPRKRLF